MDRNKIKIVLFQQFKDALISVFPVSLIILVLSLSLSPLPSSVFVGFVFGTLMMVIGMALFTLGAEMSMTPMGEYVGTNMTRSKKIWLICLLTLFVGTMITVSEPDLQVLAGYVPAIDTTVFIIVASIGVGAFLVIAMLRIILSIKVRYILLVSYAVIFVLAAFVSSDFWTVAFDAGGVTTGALSVPFIMSMGVGVAAISSDKREGNDSFGLMALCSVGPIITVLALGLFYSVGATDIDHTVNIVDTSRDVGFEFLRALPENALEVGIGLLPILIFFFIYQLIVKPLDKKSLARMGVGVGYTFIGILLFLVGVNVGFMPAGSYIGQYIGQTDYRWILVPLGAVFGYFIVSAEPAVHVLEKQVEEATNGSIQPRLLRFAMSAGVAIAVALAMLRVLTGISIMWFVGIGYAAALLLSFFVPDVFTSIAFDSGGVAAGSMTSAFLMPLAVGVAAVTGGNVMTDAFGVLAMVSVIPTISIQLLGLIYRIKSREKTEKTVSPTDIIDFDLNSFEIGG